MLLNSIPFANLRKKTYIAKFLTFYRGQLLFDHATPFGWGHGRPDRASRRGLDALLYMILTFERSKRQLKTKHQNSTTFWGFPSMNALTLAVAISMSRWRASAVAQAICGVKKALWA